MTDIPSIPTERFSYHELSTANLQVFSSGQEIVIDHHIGYVALLQWNRMHQQILDASLFSQTELALLFPLFSRWPSFVPYDLLFRAIRQPAMATPTPSQLDDAWVVGTLEDLVAPLKTVLEACRDRLQALGLDIREVERYGYKLVAARKEAQS